ncbi:unnamed protein product [Didymodactylos carnosus]|uniref:Aminotransferase class I/classII large domain-containing protein n=1 Tax=Didymodactylos carnosus TaxID=1234261 RepID=A0A8S2JMK2_9BILA|nr:unnamed protein product [Didymodactylos carnosus]CAF3814482.1 unnamed protein product [Didymodactylos carnosus]
MVLLWFLSNTTVVLGGRILPPDIAYEALIEVLANRQQTPSYQPTFGSEIARTAVAQFLSNSYDCHLEANPDRNWEIDLKHLESLIDKQTKAVIINNPSNPCGSVYSAQHLQDIIAVCERNRIPIIADEIYADMVFDETGFFYLGTLSENVPILSCGGISKTHSCPGWRLGWIAIHDRHCIFQESVKQGLINLTTVVLGPSSIIQAALPRILAETPQSYFHSNLTLFAIFGAPNYIRFVLSVPCEIAAEACKRLIEFCKVHVANREVI